VTTETGRQPATADAQPGVEARLARLEGAIEGLGGKVELTRQGVVISAIATKLDAMPQHLPPPRKPEEP